MAERKIAQVDRAPDEAKNNKIDCHHCGEIHQTNQYKSCISGKLISEAANDYQWTPPQILSLCGQSRSAIHVRSVLKG